MAQLLDIFISKQQEFKELTTFIAELRKQIQMAIELGELDPLSHQDKFIYDILEIQTVERKTWKYSTAVETLKEREQFNGHAKQTITTSYRFTLKEVPS